jgi:hypothetical protein
MRPTTITERIRAQDSPTVRAPSCSRPPPGAREWLGELLARGVGEAEAAASEGALTYAGDCLSVYVLGWLIGASSLSELEQLALLERCARRR